MKSAIICAVILVTAGYGFAHPTPPVESAAVEEVTKVFEEVPPVTEHVLHHNDPSVILSDPIDGATKLLIDLNEHVQKYLPSSDDSVDAPTTSEPQIYGAVDDDLDIALTKQDQISTLLDQLDTLQNRIQETINQLVSRRRYVLSAMLRPMVTYVRRVRNNLERLQTRLQAVSAVATSGNNASPGQNPSGPAAPPGVDSSAIDSIRRRIDEISRRIGDIVNRIRGSLSPVGTGLPAGQSPPSSQGR